jgi:WD40 repeat protein/sterol desaturase/sphingolipid hydroxylase (fatty acid hydroxylase superfamily)
MDWMTAIGDAWLSTLAWLGGLALAFGILVPLMPCNPGMYWWKDLRAVATDVLYWFVVPLFLRFGRLLLLVAGVRLLWGSAEPQFLPVRDLPLWLQCGLVLLVQDVLLYWGHRAFHTRWAWPFHAVHHSPEVLDWTSTQRFHPLNNLLTFGLADVAVLLLGFSPATLAVLTPFNVIYSALVHANLNWTFGPLRYVFASPVFHRWHHTTQAEGLDKNFAPTFPFLDLLFGTFYMPPGRLPEQFGSGEPDFPKGFWGQFLRPFRTRDAQPAQPALAGSPLRRALAWAGRRPWVILPAAGAVLAGALLGRGHVSAPAMVAPESVGDLRAGPNQHPDLHLPGHTGPILGVAISDNGAWIVSGGQDGTIKLWNGATGRVILDLVGHTRPVHSVALSADGRCLVSGSSDRTVRVWDLQTGQEKLTLTGHNAAVLGVGISAEGGHIVSGGADSSVKVWNAATGREELTLHGPPGAVLSVGVSAGGRRVVAAQGRAVKVWDGQTGEEQATLTGHADLIFSVAIRPDGRCVVTGCLDGTVKLWDAATGQEQRTLRGHSGAVYGVGMSADGRHVVSGGADQTVKLWDGSSGQEEHSFTGHADAVTCVAVSAAGRCILSGSRDGTLKIWHMPEAQAQAKGAAVAPFACASGL